MRDKEKFRRFFEINRDWINSHCLLITDNLKVFYELYYDYIYENGLDQDEGINVFRIVIKQEILKSTQMNFSRMILGHKVRRKETIDIDNPVIRKWYYQSIQDEYSNPVIMNNKQRQFIKSYLSSSKMKENSE